MSKTGPILLIEDDEDDFSLFKMALDKLEIRNRLIWFPNALLAYEYLVDLTHQPFLIFCDINMPGLNGIEFKRKIDNNPELRKKSVPFVYYTTTDDRATVETAYTHLTIQGFFKKETNYKAIQSDLKLIIDYWTRCRHPNSDR